MQARKCFLSRLSTLETAVKNGYGNSALEGSFPRLVICNVNNGQTKIIFGGLAHYKMKIDYAKSGKNWKRIEGANEVKVKG